jgi:hypothetical protein
MNPERELSNAGCEEFPRDDPCGVIDTFKSSADIAMDNAVMTVRMKLSLKPRSYDELAPEKYIMSENRLTSTVPSLSKFL